MCETLQCTVLIIFRAVQCDVVVKLREVEFEKAQSFLTAAAAASASQTELRPGIQYWYLTQWGWIELDFVPHATVDRGGVTLKGVASRVGFGRGVYYN